MGSAIGQAASGEDHIVIPRKWINDTLSNGNLDAWRLGDFANFLPNGNYRNQWYLNDIGSPAILAIGIHGQWLYIEPKSQTVIVKFSSEAQPIDEAADIELIEFFDRVCRVLT